MIRQGPSDEGVPPRDNGDTRTQLVLSYLNQRVAENTFKFLRFFVEWLPVIGR